MKNVKPKISYSLKTKCYRVQIEEQVIFIHQNYLESVKYNTALRSVDKMLADMTGGKHTDTGSWEQLINKIRNIKAG